jgi:alkylation response protein AidB-like acyl-CoA dehydrogenase
MDFTFTEEEERFREEIRDFCQKEMYGEHADVAETGLGLGFFAPEFYKKACARGWAGLTLPKEYGGQGRSKMEETIFADEMAFLDAPMAVPPLYMTTTFLSGIILKHGSEQLKRYYLPRVSKGELWIGQCFTENDAGSDLLRTATRAVRQGNYYILNGEKTYQSWAHAGEALPQYGISMHAMLLARTNLEAPPEKSLSLFVFDVTKPPLGMSIEPIMAIMGRTNELFFDNVKIPAGSLIGEENHAWDYIVESGAFYWEKRLGFILGMYRSLLDQLVKYVKETRVDGQLLSENVLIRQKMARLASGVERLRLHTYRFAWAYDKGLDVDEAASLYKFHKDHLVREFVDLAMEILGPYGQLKGGAKDAPLGGILAGLTGVELIHTFSSCGPNAMMNTIAGSLLGLPNEFGVIY